MRAILDEGVPEDLAERLSGHIVTTVGAQGWKSIKNGRLLNLIEAAGYQVFITNDKSMERQKPLDRRPFATLVLSVNNWNILRERIIDIQAALDNAKPGIVYHVDCGKFVPRRFRGKR